MKKLINWLSNHLWPWSVLSSLYTDLTNARSEIKNRDDFQEYSERLYVVTRKTIGSEMFRKVLAAMDKDYEAKYARIGNLLHVADESVLPVISKPSRQMDPKLEGSPAGNAVRLLMGDPTLPKMADVMTDYENSGVDMLKEIHGTTIEELAKKMKDR